VLLHAKLNANGNTRMSSPLIQRVPGAADASGPLSTPFKVPPHDRTDTPPFATILDNHAREHARGTEGASHSRPPACSASPRERTAAPAACGPQRAESTTRSDGSAREHVRTTAPDGSSREDGGGEERSAAAAEGATDASVADSGDGNASARESDQDGPTTPRASPAIVAAIVSMLAGRHDADDVPADAGQRPANAWQRPADAWQHADGGSASKNRNLTLEGFIARLGGDPAVAMAPGRHVPVESAPAAAAGSAAHAPSAPAATRLAELLLSHAAAGSPMPSPPLGAADALPGALSVAGVAQRLESGALQLPVHTPASQRVWAEDVGSRLIWMAGRGESKAELVLTPPSLGKLAVSIQVNGDQASAQFVAATPAARDALEQALPRLREVLQQAGIHLGEANVSTSGEQQARGDANGREAGNHRVGQRAGAAPLAETIAQPAAVWASRGLGMIDTFA
jgi:flagellar hook-length control protein FliK